MLAHKAGAVKGLPKAVLKMAASLRQISSLAGLARGKCCALELVDGEGDNLPENILDQLWYRYQMICIVVENTQYLFSQSNGGFDGYTCGCEVRST